MKFSLPKKLHKIHLFLILIFVLLASSLGYTIVEGLTDSSSGNAIENAKRKKAIAEENPYVKYGSYYDPTGNDLKNPTKFRRASDIRPEDEDLYILKSQVVPPVCPKCPDVKSCPRQEAAPPCPACKRCPASPFECKKVPNYNVPQVNDVLPLPMLNSFDQFA